MTHRDTAVEAWAMRVGNAGYALFDALVPWLTLSALLLVGAIWLVTLGCAHREVPLVPTPSWLGLSTPPVLHARRAVIDYDTSEFYLEAPDGKGRLLTVKLDDARLFMLRSADRSVLRFQEDGARRLTEERTGGTLRSSDGTGVIYLHNGGQPAVEKPLPPILDGGWGPQKEARSAWLTD